MTPAFIFLLFLSMSAVPAGAAPAVPEELDVTALLTRANEGIDSGLEHGDIVPNVLRNADPCVATGCKWPKSGDYVYIPVSISGYTTVERNFIIGALLTFHQTTCVRFHWRRRDRQFIDFFSGSGCWSYVGRQIGGQQVSLRRNGCLFTSTVQHEVLHALGFHHEQVRSDRDQFVNILSENIIPGRENNFEKEATNNLGTTYDFDSVMQYSNLAFSSNGLPTIVSKANPALNFGLATAMSPNDIARINELYECEV